MSNWKQSVFFSVAGVLVVAIAGLYLFIRGFSFLDDGGRDVDVASSEISPDGVYRASIIVESGGGAAGWCYIYVSIDRSENSADASKGEYYFCTSCHQKVAIKWLADRTLEVRSDGLGGPSEALTRKDVSRDGQIHLQYVREP